MSDAVNRREFVTTGAVAAGALALGSSRLFAQGSQTINVGIVGCGGRGSGAVINVLEADKDVKITAVCDLVEGKAKSALANFKRKSPNQVTVTPDAIFHGLDGYKQLLARPDVNYVILATPPGFRPIHLEAAVEAGKNIFTEKPVGVDVAGIRKVLDAAKKSQAKGLKIVAGTQRRHEAGYIEIMKRLHDGEFGDILSGRVYWNGNTPWFHARKPGMKDVEYQLYNWYHYLWLCGDHIVEQHVHNLDVANWAMQATPVRVNGMGGRSNRPVGDPNEVGQIFDHFALEYEYPNGVVVQSYCRQIEGCMNNVSETFVGTKGKTYTRSDYYVANGRELDRPSQPYVQEHIDLLKAIRENKPLNELEQVAHSTFTAIIGRMAAYSGQSLKWDDVLHSKPGDKWFEDTMPKNLTLDMPFPADPPPVVGRWRPKPVKG